MEYPFSEVLPIGAGTMAFAGSLYWAAVLAIAGEQLRLGQNQRIMELAIFGQVEPLP